MADNIEFHIFHGMLLEPFGFPLGGHVSGHEHVICAEGNQRDNSTIVAAARLRGSIQLCPNVPQAQQAVFR